jgi:hypothetical protein
VTKSQQVRHHYIVQRSVDTVKQFGLNVSKTEVIFQRTLGLLLRDPRITASFFLAHPVSKVSSFSKQPSDRHKDNSLDKLGYMSAWDYQDVEELELASSPQNFVGSPPSAEIVEIPVVRPRPAREVPHKM